MDWKEAAACLGACLPYTCCCTNIRTCNSRCQQTTRPTRSAAERMRAVQIGWSRTRHRFTDRRLTVPGPIAYTSRCSRAKRVTVGR